MIYLSQVIKTAAVLTDHDIEKWKYKEHTKVKHEILSKYLGAWIRILGKNYSRICYFDCFAGRSIYKDGEKGSPLLALDICADVKKRFHYLKEIVCTFIEKDRVNFDDLKKSVKEEIEKYPKKYEGITVIEPINDEFENIANGIIDKVGKNLAPSFFFIDPFGFSGVPLKTLNKLLSIQRVEIFITFMLRDVIRFLESEPHKHSIEELYNIENIKEMLSSDDYKKIPKEEALLKIYIAQLKSAGAKYTLPFKVNADEKLQTTYYLIHVTNHPKGCEIMKEIMLHSGTKGRMGYLGPAEGQMTITQMLGISKLKEFLLKKFKGEVISFQEIRYKTIMDTDFTISQYRETILELEKEGIISINGKGPRGGLPDESKISFNK
ncbi:MAG: three-Cys-motif partner protein TcmP [Elusimicrobia bacterium]|nr:three-Cys-motif partner protein TcmP [Elusimicrobiota bacterium]